MKILLFIAINTFCLNSYSASFQKVEDRAIKVLKSISPYYLKQSVDQTEILDSRKPINGSAVKSVYCNKEKIDLPNGNQELGYTCNLGLASGLNIEFNSKLEPVKISLFVP